MRSVGLFTIAGSYGIAVFLLLLHASPFETLTYGSAAFVIVVFVGKRVRNVRAGFVLFFAGAALAWVRVSVLPTEPPPTFAASIGKKDTIIGTIVTLPDMRETSSHIIVETSEGDEKMRFMAIVPTYPLLHVGDIVSVNGTLTLPKSFETDGGRTFAYADFLKKDGVFAVMQRAYAKRTGSSRSPWLMLLRALQKMKDGFMTLVGQALPEPESALAIGILVGGKQGLGTEILDQFSRSGMLQIVVLSGYNVMIVAETILKSLNRLPKRIALMLASGSIICFVLIAGAGSSAMRAGIMALIAVSARGFGKPYDVLRALMLAAFGMSIANPRMLVFDPGFQFSCIATFGLVLGVPAIERRLLFMQSGFLIEAFSTTLAAELFLLPYLLWQTGMLSTVSVFANIAAMPVLPFCMAASAISAVLAWPLGIVSVTLPPLAGLPAYLGLAYVLDVARVAAELPFASYVIPTFPFWIVIACYVAIGYALHADTKRRSREGARA